MRTSFRTVCLAGLLALAPLVARAADAPAPTPAPPAVPAVPATAGTAAAPPVPAAPATAAVAACALLTPAEVQAAQGSPVVETKAVDVASVGFAVSRCFLRTEDFARSVSLEVTLPRVGRTPGKGGVRAISPRESWQSLFHRAPSSGGDEDEEEEEHGSRERPKPVAGLGDEAFWSGNAATGALYVLKGEGYFRLSAGGPGDAAAKLAQARRLAELALPRLARLAGSSG